MARKHERKRSLGRHTSRWEDNTKMDLREIRLGGVDWTNLTQDRDQVRVLGHTAMNLQLHKMLSS